MIRSVLSVLPTRPVLYIVPALVVVVMFLYYWDLHDKCSGNKQFRTAFNQYLHAPNRPGQIRLADFTDFGWDKVRIVVNFKPERRNIECPFGWNWKSGERESLIASNLLSVLIFAYEGVIVRYYELRSDQVVFRDVNQSLTPAMAVFDVSEIQSDRGRITLDLAR